MLVAALSGLLQFSSPNQTYSTSTTLAVYTNTQTSIVSIGQTTFVTTSTYSIAAGTIPASYTSDVTGQQICYYVSYPFHVDESVQRIVGTVSGSSPFNFYIMSQTQYDDFVNKNPPCGSSYTAIILDYQRNQFNIDWTPNPGDYQILLQNMASYPITYNIQISAIGSASRVIYSTIQLTQVLTSTTPQVYEISAQSFTAASSSGTGSAYNALLPIGIIVIVIAMLVLFSRVSRRRAKEDTTKVY